ncbi:MAG: hypothetical protein PHS88_08900, partial [Candidatus Omnitrophica bacterium]|nr:hypothetical protein [Candidatus Omnitrophota bacterium]
MSLCEKAKSGILQKREKLLSTLSSQPPLSFRFSAGEDIDACRKRMAASGIREYPFPFQSALAITSDIDRSNRERYQAYMRQIVLQYGFDFDSSTWLHSNLGTYAGLGFLSRHFTFYDHGPESQTYREHGLDPYEMFSEYHKGNLDHWHSFLARGPRVVILRDIKKAGEWDTAGLPKPPAESTPHFNTNIFPVLGISVFTPKAAGVCVEKVIVETENPSREIEFRKETDHNPFDFLAADSQKDNGDFFTLFYGVKENLIPPQLKDIKAVKIKTNNAKTPVTQIYLHNIHGKIILDRLRFLDDDLNITMNLITKHAMWHFYPHEDLPEINQMNRDRLKSFPGVLESYFGSFNEAGLHFSTLADEKGSFCRLFPEITREFKIRFIRMVSGSETKNKPLKDLSDIACPSRTRNDSHIYVVHSTKPPLPPGYEPEPAYLKNKSTALTFLKRIENTFNLLRQNPKHSFIFYTHLGNLEPTDKISDPYFDPDILLMLRTHVFGFSPRRSFDKRIWFTRASVLCDYALMIQTLPEAIARPDENTVKVQSWHDPVLDMRLPQSPHQLYGVTFYVKDSATASVFLDQQPIRDLIRNEADETGRESVTVAPCGIRHVIFDEADPKAVRKNKQFGGHWHTENANWSWISGSQEADSGSSYAVLSYPKPIAGRFPGFLNKSKPKSEIAKVTLSCRGITAEGAQHFFYSLKRSSPDALFGTLIETQTNGRFYFGDEELCETVKNLTAFYVVNRKSRTRDTWQRYVIPFYDLRWKDTAADGPMPSHALKSITLFFKGAGEDRVALDRFEFGRPRTTLMSEKEKDIVIGGKVKPARAGQKVFLESLSHARTVSTVTDDWGGFYFSH